MGRIIRATLVAFCLAMTIFGQGLTSVGGTVKDPSGAIIPAAQVQLTNMDTGAQRAGVSDSAGRYLFSQVQPGTYQMIAKAPGFGDLTIDKVQLLVNTPATIDLTFEKVGSVASSVSVSADTTQVDEDDASIGNAIGGHIITQLPFESRNVVGLLAIQSGVVYLGEPNPGALNDYRSGAVNGGKSDQGNVTLDGVDVNDQQNRASFTSVLRVSLDSVQEFRTTTTNAGAEYGHSSGAQVSLVTKGGTNTVHGSAYEYLRNTDTSANSFFNNSAGVPRPQLNRNVYGASAGGPIKKDKLFYFGNYEGRKDASAATVLRTVPTATFRTGEVLYGTTHGTEGVMTPAEIQAVDPAGIGASPAVLSYLQQFPLPNAFNTGDGVNTAGYRFNASEPLRFNTYIAKFDYNLDSKNTIFVRGNLQNDNYANQAPQFPGQPANGVYLDNSKGIATGITTVLTASLINTFRYGFTREGVQTTGVLANSYADPSYASISTLYGTSTASVNLIPVNNIHDNMVWTKGAHTISFGADFLLVTNDYSTNQNSFSTANGDGLYLAGDGDSLLPADAKVSNTTIQNIATLIGDLTKNILKTNYDLAGSALPQGAIVPRSFAERHYDTYVQDTWKALPGLTISAGLRLGLNPAITETNGYNIDSSIPTANWLASRIGLAASGQSQALAGNISYDLASVTGRGIYPFHTDWAPRFAMAWSPQGNSGLSRVLFGGPDKTSIRFGWGIYYDAFGEGLEKQLSAAVGFSNSVQSGPGQWIGNSPRFTGFYNVPLSIFPPAPVAGFPQTPAPGGLAQATTLDDQLKSPYTQNMDVSIQRQLKGGFVFDASYVNRLSHRSLIGEDMATPTNLVDPASGMSYYQAVAALATYVYAKAPVSSVPNIPFWQDFWPTAAGNGLSATQNIYKDAYSQHTGDWTTALLAVDNPISASAAAGAPFSGCNAAGTLTSTQLPCNRLGGNSMFNSQFAALVGFRSIGNGNYNGLHLTLRKSYSHDVQFDFNYTYSKCIDLGSYPESSGSSRGFILNPYDQNQNKGVCDYDITNLVSALGVFGLPFGQGKALLNTSNKFVNGVIGGWQLTTVLTVASGLPLSVSNGGVYPTEWNSSGYATQTGIVPSYTTSSNAPSATPGQAGGPNLFNNPQLAYIAYSQTPAGQTGQRNGIRGQGPFSIDLGVNKTFHLFNFHDQPHSLIVRAEAFNVSNSVRFDPMGANLNIANQNKFGQYTQTIGTPRVFQFSMRYEF